MNAKRKNQIYWNILANKFNIDLNKSYWELSWEQTEIVYNLAYAFNIKPKAGASAGRTLFERAQKGRPF